MNEQVEQALEQFRGRAPLYLRNSRYYSGEHNLAFATEKFANTFGQLFREFALNLCPAICDAVKDKLKITGFKIGSENGSADKVALHEAVDRIWRANRLAIRAGEVHKEAPKNGDSYLIVWPSADGSVQVIPQRAGSCTVVYDEDLAGRIAWAGKHWVDTDKHVRLNLIFPDRIEKYISKDKHSGYLPEARAFLPYETGADAHQPNPFGVVPVFHFANNADIGSFGQSELEAAIPVQDGLNKAVLDMLVAMEVCAFRQRWVAGIEIKTDESSGKSISPFRTGVDTIWQAEDPNVRFGDFAASDLEQFLKVKDGFRIDLASVTGTPLYYLMPQVRGFPSGESLRKAEARFLSKVRDRQEQFGTVWADAIAFALRVTGHPETTVTTLWEPASPQNERELLEIKKLRREMGMEDNTNEE